MCLGHPHEVHVAGQQREVAHGLGVVRTAEVAVGQQNIDDQLQVGLPSNRLPEQNHTCAQNLKSRVQAAAQSVVSCTVKVLPVLTFNYRKTADSI